MKNLIISAILILISLVSFSQRNTEDAKSIAKVNEIHKKITPLLTGHVTNEDIKVLSEYLYTNKVKNDRLVFLSISNPYTDKLNTMGHPTDVYFISQAFRLLEDIKNVIIKLESVDDIYPEINHELHKSARILNYTILFKNDNSFGKNVDNYIDFRIYLVDCEITSIAHQVRYL